jgi:hypothetical protein
MLAVIGMQSTLRLNGDLAKQRSEAVRIAQDHIEEWRGFVTIPNTLNKMAYVDIVTGTASVTGINATYNIARSVVDEPVVAGTVGAARKTLEVEVTWVDRTSENQSVILSTVIAGVEPELEGSILMATNTSPVVQPRSRNRGIPPGAKNIGGGKSAFIPPGQPTPVTSQVVWVFDNTTAVIQVCTTTAATIDLLTSVDASTCQSDSALLVSGFLQYDDSMPPTTTTIASPSAAVPNLGLTIEATAAPSAPTCFQDTTDPLVVPYYCAVPIDSATPKWTGKVFFDSPAMATASSTAPAVASLFKVCRYATVSAQYTNQETALNNVNFVFLRAGSASSVFSCPAPLLAFQP